MTTYVDNVYMVTEECCNCGMTFAITQDFKRRRLADQKPFYCPAGHRQWYTGKTKEQKLAEELKKVSRELAGSRSNVVNLTRQKEKVVKQNKRIRDRVKNGVCPCCNRQFQALFEHMTTKHPEFGQHDILKSIRNVYGMTQHDLAKEVGVSASSISSYENKNPVSQRVEQSIERWLKDSA